VSTLTGYVAFLTNVVQLNMVNLPAFSGLGTLVEGSTTLTITAATTGLLVNNAIVTDANGAIPAYPANATAPTTVAPLLPVPPVGVGTFTMSAAALSTQSTAEAITGTNEWITASYGIALETVNCALQLECMLYDSAVYNLATDRLLNWAPDIANQTYFSDLRREMKITRPALGVASSGSDQGSSGSVLNPEFMRNLTLGDLQLLRTPYGRAYLGIAQDFGSTLWGVS
jgi:hypothetical protein